MKPVPCISFFNHSYFAVVKSFISPFVEPISYDGFIIISLALFVNIFELKNPVFASIRIFSQYKLSVFIYFSQSYLGFFFAIFILNFLYSVIFLHVSKKERGKIKFSIFPPLLSIYFFIFMEPLPFFLLPADIWHIALSKYRYCSLRSQ